MTRETKIGLLVGLAFIIVIGILLSDHLTSATDPPQAALGGAGNGVRQAVGSPGENSETGSASPVMVVTPVVTPQQPVATQSELTTPTPAVQIVKIGGPQTIAEPPSPSPAPAPRQQPVADNAAPSATASAAAANDTPLVTQVTAPAPATPTDTELSKVAESHGEQLVSADDTQTQAGAAKSYVAQPGDSLSKIAAKFFGSGGKANRELIIKANPSLAANEDMIIAGKTYQIPAKSAVKAKAAVADADNTAPDGPASSDTAQATVDDTTAKTASATEEKTSKAASDAGYLYTVQPGDNLTRIAREEVGDVHAIAAIQELNPDKLKGANHDIVIAGSKIRLPGKPLARAD